MANVPVKVLKDKNQNAFVPFTIVDAVFEADSDKTLKDIMAEQKEYVDAAVEHVDEIAESIPTKVSDLPNDAGYITDADIPTNLSEFNNDVGYITNADIPTKVSDLTNDIGFITNTVNNLTNYYDKSAVDAKVSSVYRYKGSVNAYSDLPSTGQIVGDVYNIATADTSHHIKAGDNVAWNGNAWDVLSGDIDLSDYYTKTQVDTALGNKVDKVTGKDLSTNDYTTAEQTKLAGIETGAEVNDIDTIQVNGVTQTVTNKTVDISVPLVTHNDTTSPTFWNLLDREPGFYAFNGNLVVSVVADPNDPGEIVAMATGGLVVMGVKSSTVQDGDVLAYGYKHTGVGYKLVYDANATSGKHVKIVNYATQVATVNDLPTVNDATLTIQKNGTTLDTFSANASSNKTVNITVPTTLGDLDANAANLVHDASYVHTDNNYTTAEQTKLANIEAGADVNLIESISVNNTTVSPVNKNVNITVPTLTDSLNVWNSNIAASAKTVYNLNTSKYEKPSGGIPATDLTSAIQTSLGKADTALQTESDPVFSASAAAGITTTDINNWNAKQDELVSSVNIRTVNGNSLLGSGDIAISGGCAYYNETSASGFWNLLDRTPGIYTFNGALATSVIADENDTPLMIFMATGFLVVTGITSTAVQDGDVLAYGFKTNGVGYKIVYDANGTSRKCAMVDYNSNIATKTEVPSSNTTGYVAADTQFLTHDSSGNIEWTTIANGNGVSY